mmetsp:Transcript_26345/g.87302  ORF Transcript_26345/g.87302 Transcript_26345/m.87302 type:complete len:222 (+) Transcript_26345:1142-1807(+)
MAVGASRTGHQLRLSGCLPPAVARRRGRGLLRASPVGTSCGGSAARITRGRRSHRRQRRQQGGEVVFFGGRGAATCNKTHAGIALVLLVEHLHWNRLGECRDAVLPHRRLADRGEELRRPQRQRRLLGCHRCRLAGGDSGAAVHGRHKGSVLRQGRASRHQAALRLLLRPFGLCRSDLRPGCRRLLLRLRPLPRLGLQRCELVVQAPRLLPWQRRQLRRQQ